MTREEILKIAKPILFSTDMVKAILSNKKSVTRRLVKPTYKSDEFSFRVVTNNDIAIYVEKLNENGTSFSPVRIVNPPYKVGDILYVRETWQYLYELDGNENILFNTGKYYYAATDILPSDSGEYIDNKGVKKYIPWKPSIHMPKKAARIFLKVKDVQVRRLQEMGYRDFLLEGIHVHNKTEATFIKLWNSTISKEDKDKYSWLANPWVWVIEFEKIEVE